MTARLHPLWQKRRLGFLCFLITAGILFATLWPFDLFPSNKVIWLPGKNGIRFLSPGVVLSDAPFTVQGSNPDKSCSLELLLRPATVESSTTLLGFYTPENPNQFLVRQWTDGLLVTHAKRGTRRTQFDVDHAFQEGKLLLLTLTSGPGGTVVYLNGKQARVFPKFLISRAEFSGQIVLGTAPEDYQPWSGEVSGLAIYSRELTPTQVSEHYRSWIEPQQAAPLDLNGATAYFDFAERAGRDIRNKIASEPDLEIPRWFKVPRKAFLKSPVREFAANWDYFNDVLRNIAGFLPFGFLVCAYFACTRKWPQSILYATLAGGMLSFMVEILQVYIPPRNSGITDIITNTTGAALGALLARSDLIRNILAKAISRNAPETSDSTRG